MVKVKTDMSTDSSEGETDALAAVKDKLRIQQRLIDISARSFLGSRSASADLSQSFESQSALEVQKENIALLEVSRPSDTVVEHQPKVGRYLKRQGTLVGSPGYIALPLLAVTSIKRAIRMGITKNCAKRWQQ